LGLAAASAKHLQCGAVTESTAYFFYSGDPNYFEEVAMAFFSPFLKPDIFAIF
jgi:hypothetical protein